MTCYHPLDAWISKTGEKTLSGNRVVIFNPPNAHSKIAFEATQVPCGRCIGCRLKKSREWSVRCMHEASQYWHNCWLTLTMNDDYLSSRPDPFSLQKGNGSEFTLFMKRLRKKFGSGIRFYMCGEYGETCFSCNKSEKFCDCGNWYSWRGRPHYHVCLFNCDFDDKRPFKSINGKMHYNSDTLDSLWTDPKTGKNMGYATISDLTYDSAAYTARYCMKKITGKKAEDVDPRTGLKHYQRITENGEVVDLLPEYTLMSRGSKKLGTGGIGKGWLDKYKKEVLDNDSVYFKEMKVKPPRYYDTKLELSHPEIIEENKKIRVDLAINNPDNTPERLEVREYIAQQKADKLTRKEI